jgi:hypothetical protein
MGKQTGNRNSQQLARYRRSHMRTQIDSLKPVCDVDSSRLAVFESNGSFVLSVCTTTETVNIPMSPQGAVAMTTQLSHAVAERL